MAALFSYVVARDYGFAPNPFFGFCTLATCKPIIRKNAVVGDWVVGTGSKTHGLKNKIVYTMRIDEVLSFDEYWVDQRFLYKRPNLKGSLKQLYGDNIYHRDAKGHWIQEDSHHSQSNGRPNKANIDHDTRVSRVLVSQRYIYYGSLGPVLPDNLPIACPSQGHRKFSDGMYNKFITWIDRQGPNGCRGDPYEFCKHRLKR